MMFKLLDAGKVATLGREKDPPGMYHADQQRVDGVFFAREEAAKLCFGQPRVHGNIAQQFAGFPAVQIGAQFHRNHLL